ncbi:RecA protein [Eubacterium saphenum ATCC 49989]|nr:RecA protein [Eubacterium saphenum ATCC 49989]
MAAKKNSKEEVVALKDDKEKERALNDALDLITKQFGKGSIMRLGEGALYDEVDVISTGAISLDVATGIGGIPRGRIVEVYGPESSGKTTLTLHVIAEAQKNGGRAAFIDAEHALDPEYARKLGVDVENLIVSQPSTGEDALSICDYLVRSGAIDVVVIDSVAALVPRTEIEGEMGSAHVGLQARLMSQALRKLTGATQKSNTALIFINQLREKVGNIYNPETTTGGRALKFYSSMRLDVRRSESIKTGDGIIGNKTKVKLAKNKMAPPFKQVEFDIIFGEGISKEGDVLDEAVTAGLVNKSGAWYSMNSEKIGQGRDAAKKYLKDNPKIYEELRSEILDIVFNKDREDESTEDSDTSQDIKTEPSQIQMDEDGIVL